MVETFLLERYFLTEKPVYNIKKIKDNFLVWHSQLGVISKSTNATKALNQAEKKVSNIIESFEKAGISLNKISETASPKLTMSLLVKANLISFTFKSIIILTILMILILVGSRVLPMRGLSDLAAYARITPKDRISSTIRDAKEIGQISRPILGELGLGCSCGPKE